MDEQGTTDREYGLHSLGDRWKIPWYAAPDAYALSFQLYRLVRDNDNTCFGLEGYLSTHNSNVTLFCSCRFMLLILIISFMLKNYSTAKRLCKPYEPSTL